MSAPSPAPPPLPIRNSYWVIQGQLLAGEYPGGSSPDQTRERLKQLLAAGVECFIDLTYPGELDRYDTDLPLGIEYLRKPIKDHGLPEKLEHMTEILDCVHDALRSGRTVYLHCHAGIGRTGTVVGCFLVERGLEGDEALDELNRLFQQSERAKSWDWVPETQPQTAFVRDWTPRLQPDMPLPAPGVAAVAQNPGATRSGVAASGVAASTAAHAPAPRSGVAASPVPARPPTTGRPHDPDPLLEDATLSAVKGLRIRFHGALFGLATGDALAAATQYRRPGTFAAVGDLLGGGPFDLPRGAWSDDTAMALCLADSLTACNGFDARDQVERYVRWQRDGYLSATGQCLGITASTARALAMAQWRRQAFSGSHDPNQLDPESLSRVAAPAMFFFASADEAALQASESSRATCQAPAVLEACRVFAQILHAALSGQPKASIMALAPGPVDAAPAATASASEVLTAALWAFGSTGSFRDAVLRAVNVGGNSDVVAAVCGQLAGAHYCVTAIPASWRNSLMQKDLIESLADRLLAHALLGLGG